MTSTDASPLTLPVPAPLHTALEERARWLGLPVEAYLRHCLTVCTPDAGFTVDRDIAAIIGALRVLTSDMAGHGHAATAALLERLAEDLTTAWGTLFVPNDSVMDRDDSLEQIFDADHADPAAHRYNGLIDIHNRG